MPISLSICPSPALISSETSVWSGFSDNTESYSLWKGCFRNMISLSTNIWFFFFFFFFFVAVLHFIFVVLWCWNSLFVLLLAKYWANIMQTTIGIRIVWWRENSLLKIPKRLLLFLLYFGGKDPWKGVSWTIVGCFLLGVCSFTPSVIRFWFSDWLNINDSFLKFCRLPQFAPTPWINSFWVL